MTDAVAGAHIAHTREVRDDRNRVLSVHRWDTNKSRVFSIVRQTVINALAAAARRAGAEIITGSTAQSATADGELLLASGERLTADLIIGADGVNSVVRDGLGLVRMRRRLPDGAIRMLIEQRPEEPRFAQPGVTIEYWSGSRRILFTPCSETEIYIALTMLDRDEAAKRVPVDKAEWTRSFPHLADLIARFGEEGRYDAFELIKLKRWSAGRVAILGDAAHAQPPNIGQGAGCGMMNGLALAVHLEQSRRGHPGPRRLGAERTPAHRTYPAGLVPARDPDHLAAAVSQRGARDRRALQVDRQPAHQDGAAPPDRDRLAPRADARDLAISAGTGRAPAVPFGPAARTRIVLRRGRVVGSRHISLLFLADTGRKVGLRRLAMADRSLRNSEAPGALGARTCSETCHGKSQKSRNADGQQARAKRQARIFRGVSRHHILLAVHPTPLHLVPRNHR